VRFTDYMAGTKKFIAVTNAEVTRLDCDGATVADGSLDLNRDHVEFIMPAG